MIVLEAFLRNLRMLFFSSVSASALLAVSSLVVESPILGKVVNAQNQVHASA